MSGGSTTKSGLGFALGQPPADGITNVCWGGEAGGSELLLASSWDSSVRLYDPQAAVSSGNPNSALRAVFSGEAAVLDCAFVDGRCGVWGMHVELATTVAWPPETLLALLTPPPSHQQAPTP